MKSNPNRDADLDALMVKARYTYSPIVLVEMVMETARLARAARDDLNRIAGYWQGQALSASDRADLWCNRAEAAEARVRELQTEVERLREESDRLDLEDRSLTEIGTREHNRARVAEAALAELRAAAVDLLTACGKSVEAAKHWEQINRFNDGQTLDDELDEANGTVDAALDRLRTLAAGTTARVVVLMDEMIPVVIEALEVADGHLPIEFAFERYALRAKLRAALEASTDG